MAKKIRLSQTYIRNGKFYNTGEVEVDDETFADLEQREAKRLAARPATEPAVDADGRPFEAEVNPQPKPAEQSAPRGRRA